MKVTQSAPMQSFKNSPRKNFSRSSEEVSVAEKSSTNAFASPSTHPKALIYRASHRGTKENDMILGPFARAHVFEMEEKDRAIFAEFLECADEHIYTWLREEGIDTPAHFQELVKNIRDFQLGTAYAQKAEGISMDFQSKKKGISPKKGRV